MGLSADVRSRLRFALGNRIGAGDEVYQAIQGIGTPTGRTFYVQSTSAVASDNDSRDGLSASEPLATLAEAITRCTASVGDVIVLLPGHAETTTAIAMSTAGVAVVGVGFGSNRPTLTATTASSDLISVTGANCHIENVILVGAASGCTALLNIAAADFTGINIVQKHGAAPLVATTVVAASHRFKLIDCQWIGTAAGPDVCVDLEFGAGLTTNDWSIIRPVARYGGSSGLDDAFLRVMLSCTGYTVEDAYIVGFDTLAIDINSSTLARGDGIITGYAVSSADLTFANTNDAGGASFLNFLVAEGPATKGKAWPAATPD